MNKFLKRFLRLKNKFKRIKIISKGFSRDPFFCLGLISVILFGVVSLGAGPILKSLYNKGDFSLATVSEIFNETEKKDLNLFVGPAGKFWSESPEFLLVGNNSLQAASPPTTFSPQVLGALVGGFELEDTKKIIVEYIVDSGDSLWSIAAEFDISRNTILWANDLNKNSLLQPGQKLVILPVSGLIHHIKAGDTISEIAQRYKGKTDEIITINNLSNEGDIYIGDIVIIPNGVMPSPSTQYAPAQVPLANSYFICPISAPCRVTQWLHWYNAIDFSHRKCREPVYAAAGGKVLRVKLTNSTSRWAFGGAGNHLTILHPNGVVTMYGHIANSFVNPGDQVSQGQVIALIGGQPGTAGAGLSTACHLHFGVRGARNPFTK